VQRIKKLKRKQRIWRAIIVLAVIAVVVFDAFSVMRIISSTPSRPENTAPFVNFSPNVKLPTTWQSQTSISHIWIPNPANSQSNFPVDVNVTVLSENFNQGALAYIIVDITIPNSLVTSLNVRTLAFNIGVANASRVNSSETDLEPPTGPFYMLAWPPQNFYFPNRTASALIPYDWGASDYIIFNNTGEINLNLQYGSTAGENVTPTADWMQRNFMNVTLAVPINILPYGTVYIAPTPPPKETFLGMDYGSTWYSATGFVIYFILLYPLYLIIEIEQERGSKKFWGFVKTFGLEVTLGAGGISLFIMNLPFDAPYLFFQIVYVVALSLLGVVLIDKMKGRIKQKLIVWQIIREIKEKPTENKPEKETDHAPETKKEQGQKSTNKS
jgi:hypothetical protein